MKWPLKFNYVHCSGIDISSVFWRGEGINEKLNRFILYLTSREI
jgi:hypothetical protein